MKKTAEIRIYEIDGEEPPLGEDAPHLHIESHWNNDRLINLHIGGKVLTVSVNDLADACKSVPCR